MKSFKAVIVYIFNSLLRISYEMKHHHVLSTDNHLEKLRKRRLIEVNPSKHWTNETISFLTIHKEACLTDRCNTTTNEYSFSTKGIESFMHKRLPQVKKAQSKEKSFKRSHISSLSQHKTISVDHKAKNRGEKINIKVHHNLPMIKIRPLVLINRSIQLSIKKAIVKKSLEKLQKSVRSFKTEPNEASSVLYKEEHCNPPSAKKIETRLRKNHKVNNMNAMERLSQILNDHHLFPDKY